MEPTAAINVALALTRSPAAAKRLSRAPLPEGVTELLAMAAGNPEALQAAQAQTEQSTEALRAAAAFFIEQVMFAENADSYRILGAAASAPRSQLRRHMVLLMSWLHPDAQEQRTGWGGVDRSVFIHRVIRAWADLKNDERRGYYDRTLGARIQRLPSTAVRADNIPQVFTPLTQLNTGNENRSRETQRFRRLVMFRLQHALLPSRLLSFLRDRQ